MTKPKRRQETFQPIGDVVRRVVEAAKHHPTGEKIQRGTASGLLTDAHRAPDAGENAVPIDRDAREATPRVFKFRAYPFGAMGRPAIWGSAFRRPANDNLVMEW